MSSTTPPPPTKGGVVPSEATPPNGTIPIASDITSRETGSDSTPDIIHKSNLPVLLINEGEGEGEGEGEEVKSKTVKGHTRGSSVSSTPGSHLGTCETNTTTTSSSSSLSNSYYSHDGIVGETASFPGGLSHLISSGDRTSSDPLLMLAAATLNNKSDTPEDTVAKLVQEVVSLKLEMMKLKEENDKMKRTRSDMDEELHTLTENLFEEAYKMVDEAKGERFTAEKRLADAAGQLEAMETQVSTLHNLLKTPSSKVSPSQKHKRSSVKKIVKKLSRGSRHHSSSKVKEQQPLLEHKGHNKEWILKEGEVPSADFTSFKDWYDNGLSTVSGSGSYYDTILNNNILPCLQFTNKELSDKVYAAVKGCSVVLEPVTSDVLKEGEESTTPPVKKCQLSGEESIPCTFKLRISETSDWIYITSTTRERIVSVCDFYTFIGYIQKGIIKKEVTDVYWRVAKLRAVMCLSVLSLSLPDTVQ